MPTGIYIRTEYHKRINSKSHKNQIPWNKNKKGSQISSRKGKTLEEEYGVERAKEISIKLSKWQKGKIYEQTMGSKIAKECRRKQRLKAIERINKNYGKCCPNYNPKACEIFKQFDEKNNTQGYYAMYGNGEHYIEELGYFLDYINFDKKLIIEVDEKHHFDKSGLLKSKDIKRQQEIKNLYPDFNFLRFEEKDINKILQIKIGGVSWIS